MKPEDIGKVGRNKYLGEKFKLQRIKPGVV